LAAKEKGDVRKIVQRWIKERLLEPRNLRVHAR
jgi:hypothetical protein